MIIEKLFSGRCDQNHLHTGFQNNETTQLEFKCGMNNEIFAHKHHQMHKIRNSCVKAKQVNKIFIG